MSQVRTVHNDKKSTYENLVVWDGSVSVHKTNLKILATAMFKVQKDFSSPIFKEIFNNKTLNYELWHPPQFTIPKIKSVYNGFESTACLGPKIWNMLLSELKEMS